MDSYKGMTDHDLLITVAQRQELMLKMLEGLKEQVGKHDRAISRIWGIGTAVSALLGGILVFLGIRMR